MEHKKEIIKKKNVHAAYSKNIGMVATKIQKSTTKVVHITLRSHFSLKIMFYGVFGAVTFFKISFCVPQKKKELILVKLMMAIFNFGFCLKVRSL